MFRSFVYTDKPNNFYTGMYKNRLSTDDRCQKLSGDWPPRQTHINVTIAQLSAGSVKDALPSAPAYLCVLEGVSRFT
jgi:hypothetical protein